MGIDEISIRKGHVYRIVVSDLRVGVGIDEEVNGMFLPALRDYAGRAASHLTIHTKKSL